MERSKLAHSQRDTTDRNYPRPGDQTIGSNQENQSDEFSESSDDEDEDEDGNLATENIDKGIMDVLAALRSNSDRLKNKDVKFFPEIGAEGTAEAQEPSKREKPVYLKDYQRNRLLERGVGGDDEADGNEEHPETYVQEQARVRNDLINQFHTSDNDEEDGGDDLLQKRTEERVIPEVNLPNPEKDESGFLDAFISQRAWVPQQKDELPTYGEVVEDKNEDSDEFEDLSEKFESAYNFRYEDPNAAEIVSYARDQNTLRRDKKGSRQKKREKEREQKEKEKEQQKLEMAKLRKSKVNEVTDKLTQLQGALGEGEERVAELLAKDDLLDGDFDNDEWDKRMQKLFDDEYYGRGDSSDHKNIPGELHTEEDVGEAVGEAGTGDDIGEPMEDDTPSYEAPAKKLSRKDLKRKAEQFVESNEDLLVDETIKPTAKFVYRSVDPENFGLTSRDILLASDKELNQYVGLKKLASYREKEKMEQDRKRYSKRKRLRQWRKDVFGTEDSPTDELWEKAKQEEAKNAEAEKPKTKHKSKKRKHN